MNARSKGARGEREWRDQLRANGYTARRGGQQGAGGSADSPDVICPELAQAIHFEVKRVQNLSIHAAMKQAVKDCQGRSPVVAHRRNQGDWLVTMPAWVFFPLLRGGVEELSECIASATQDPIKMGWVGVDGKP